MLLVVGDLDFLTLGARFLEFASLGCDKPRFFVEVAYPREDRDFVLIHLEFGNIHMYILRHMICSLYCL